MMGKLKILVFEYITGGGFNTSELPGALAREGLLMLSSLINDLAKIERVDFLVMLDNRLCGRINLPASQCAYIKAGHDSWQEFQRLLLTCDAVWPIAPETDGILQKLCELVERSGKLLLTSPASVVALTGNKWLTYQHLRQHAINTVATERLEAFNYANGEWIIKPVDGVGCQGSHLITSQDEFYPLVERLDASQYIIQPHLQGQKTSLSCLFKQGKGWLVCVNLQRFDINNRQYQLTGIDININTLTSRYIGLVDGLAKALPGLWGYVGIDLIETDEEIKVLEINPRLTTSYAGIHEARGINCVHAVLALLNGEPRLETIIHQTVPINLVP